MRLLHPKTLEIASKRKYIPKTVLSHAWSEVFKYLATGQKHPKVFITDEYYLGVYMSMVYEMSQIRGCNFDKSKINNYSKEFSRGFREELSSDHIMIMYTAYFDDNYLFSDACSLYFKGINIFPDIFGDEWRKYVPVESHKEIHRQITKTINK
ncbi:MAG: hypothetical protein ACEPOW_13855 [Bacteroidales bacterium]